MTPPHGQTQGFDRGVGLVRGLRARSTRSTANLSSSPSVARSPIAATPPKVTDMQDAQRSPLVVASKSPFASPSLGPLDEPLQAVPIDEVARGKRRESAPGVSAEAQSAGPRLSKRNTYLQHEQAHVIQVPPTLHRVQQISGRDPPFVVALVEAATDQLRLVVSRVRVT